MFPAERPTTVKTKLQTLHRRQLRAILKRALHEHDDDLALNASRLLQRAVGVGKDASKKRVRNARDPLIWQTIAEIGRGLDNARYAADSTEAAERARMYLGVINACRDVEKVTLVQRRAKHR